MNTGFIGQCALITGASRGIGKAIALTLGKQGATIIGTATTGEGAGNISKFLADEKISGFGQVLDVTNDASIGQLADELKAKAIIPAILVNNAGIARDNLLIRMKDEEWHTVIATNLDSIYKLSRLVIRDMMKARYGRIINITSVVAMSGNPGQTNYAAAKAGIIGFTKSLAKEVGSRNITVNAVAPGFIQTDMTEKLTAEQRDYLLGQIALGRLGEVNEIADVVAFLASPAAGYITGETINVNGGMYMA